MGIERQTMAGLVGLTVLTLAGCSPPAGSPAEPATPASSHAPAAPAATAPAAGDAAAPSAASIPANQLACGGAFGTGTTLDSLKAAFGAAAVREEELYGPEGITFPGIVIHGDDPARRIEVTLAEATADGPGGGSVAVRGGPSRWALPSGITVGSSFADVAAANRGPFQLSGLGWDYGGIVNDWQGGALAGDELCRVQITFGLKDDAGDVDTSILGDTILSSTNPALANPAVVVSEVGLSWEDPGPKD